MNKGDKINLIVEYVRPHDIEDFHVVKCRIIEDAATPGIEIVVHGGILSPAPVMENYRDN